MCTNQHKKSRKKLQNALLIYTYTLGLLTMTTSGMHLAGRNLFALLFRKKILFTTYISHMENVTKLFGLSVRLFQPSSR